MVCAKWRFHCHGPRVQGPDDFARPPNVGTGANIFHCVGFVCGPRESMSGKGAMILFAGISSSTRSRLVVHDGIPICCKV